MNLLFRQIFVLDFFNEITYTLDFEYSDNYIWTKFLHLIALKHYFLTFIQFCPQITDQTNP
jgi:hypothetical protein